MKNGIIFGIAYGEMLDLLAWKRVASLIKFLRMDFMDLFYYLKDLKMLYLDLWYLEKFDTKIFLTRNEFEGFKNLVNILGISKVFVKLLESEPCFDFM